MYGAFLTLHSWVRWFVLAFGAIAVVQSAGAASRRRWTPADDRAAKLFTIALDIQFLLGVILYALLSPATAAAFADFGSAMHVPSLRYWSVEHETGMLIALVLAHVVRARLPRMEERRRGRNMAIACLIALVLIVASVPWPGMPNGRPLFRF